MNQINHLTDKQPALTTQSVITPENLKAFLALPWSDETAKPRIAGVGPGFAVYLELCKNQAENIASALQTLRQQDMKGLEKRYNVNFPHLVSMLLEFGGLGMEQMCNLLLWFRKVSEEFDYEIFIGEAVTAVRNRLEKYASPGERLQKLEEFLIHLNPSGKWGNDSLDLFRAVFPENSFTYRLTSALDLSALCLDKHWRLKPHELDFLGKTLLTSYTLCGQT